MHHECWLFSHAASFRLPDHRQQLNVAHLSDPMSKCTLLVMALQVSSRFGLNRGASKRLSTPAAAEQDAGNTDFSEKLLHLAWHPEANLIAAAASNSLYMFCAK